MATGLKFEDQIRYVFPAVTVLLGIYIWDSGVTLRGWIDAYRESLVSFIVIAILFTLVASTILYHVYRFTLYNPFITKLHDNRWRRKHNYRTYLKKTFKDLQHDEIVSLFIDLRDEHFHDRYANMKIQASTIHFLYMSAFINFFYFVAFSYTHPAFSLFSLGNIQHYYLLSSLLLFALAYKVDQNYESREYTLVMNLSHTQLKKSYEKIIDQRRY